MTYRRLAGEATSVDGGGRDAQEKEKNRLTTSSSRDIRPIDHNSPVPYYYQLADILREEIERGRWSADELIPAEGALTEIFGVSRSVTRKALDLLEGEGRVLRIKGKGTVVTRPRISYEASETAGRWFSARPAAVRLGRVVGARRVQAGGHLGRLLDLSPRDDVWEVTLTHTLDGAPVSLSQMYLRIQGTLSVGAPPEFDAGGPDILQQLATKYELEIAESQMEITVGEASSFEAETLDIAPGSPVVEVSSLDFVSQERMVGFSRTVVPARFFFFSVDVRRSVGTMRDPMFSGMVAKTTD